MLICEYLSDSAKELWGRLCTKEFDALSLRKDLETGKYSAEDVNMAALDYVDDCATLLIEVENHEEILPGELVPGLFSSHLLEALELLLNFGLDPNWVFREECEDGHVEEYNIMDQLGLVDNGYQAADALYLLLSRGGNPNLVLDDMRLSTDPYFDLWFDTCNRDMLYDALYGAKVHYTMVLIGFAAQKGDNKEPIDPVGDFDLSLLRNHRDYYVGAIHSDKSEDGMELCFFDRHTNWEVARF